MRIKIDIVCAIFLVFAFLSATHIISSSIPIRIAGFTFFGVVRAAAIPIGVLLFIVLATTKAKTLFHKLYLFSIPVILISLQILLQFFLLPSLALQSHITASADFLSLFITYLLLLLTVNTNSTNKISNFLLLSFQLILLAAILYEPFLILQSGQSIFSVLANYGDRSAAPRTATFWGSSNDSANILVMLLPFGYLFLERFSRYKKKILIPLFILYIFVVLTFNSTRTALLGSFPLITFLYYSNLSTKKIALLSISLLPLAVLGASFITSFVNQAFAGEDLYSGTFGWRYQNLWQPGVAYTLENSPINGFGSGGWGYVYTSIYGGSSYANVHNAFIWTYVSWGLVGLISYIALLLILSFEAYRLSRFRLKYISNIGKACFCSVIAYIFWSLISGGYGALGLSPLLSVAAIIVCTRVSIINLIHSTPRLDKLDQLKNYTNFHQIL